MSTKKQHHLDTVFAAFLAHLAHLKEHGLVHDTDPFPEGSPSMTQPSEAQEPVKEVAPTMPVTPVADSPATQMSQQPKGTQQHDHTHSHGTFVHNHVHLHPEGDAHETEYGSGSMGTGEHAVHTHCPECGADDKICGHVKKRAARESATGDASVISIRVRDVAGGLVL